MAGAVSLVLFAAMVMGARVWRIRRATRKAAKKAAEARAAATAAAEAAAKANAARYADLPAETLERYGLVPREKLSTKTGWTVDPEMREAFDAVQQGQWEPVAELFATLGANWRLRDKPCNILADEAAQDDGWLKAWRTAHPEDGTAAGIHSLALVRLAWNIRGAKFAKDTTTEQFQGFSRVLESVPDACSEAAALAPDDPMPWVAHLSAGMGLGYSHEQFTQVWDELQKRDPFHYGAHSRALQYWHKKWQGSDELALTFARDAVAKAPVGSLLTSILLSAYYEIFRDGRTKPETYRTEEVHAALDLAVPDTDAAAAEGHPYAGPARHMLVWFLHKAGRDKEAFEQLRHIDGSVAAQPWTTFKGPTDVYVEARRKIVLAAT